MPLIAGRQVEECAGDGGSWPPRTTAVPLITLENTHDIATLLKDARQKHPDVHVRTVVVCGNTVPTLIEASRNSRLLVVGAHRRTGALSLGAGYVVRGLLSHSPTPVAVVPTT